METNLRQMARHLLETGDVDAVIGFRQGSLPWMTEPFMAQTPDQADQLVFNSCCRMNLAVYLTPELFSSKKRVAVTAKGCDSRNMVTQIQESRYTRKQVHIIGLPCTGMADKTKLAASVPAHITAVADQGQDIAVTTDTGQFTVAKSEVLQDNCRTCIRRNPVIWDQMAADPVEELALDDTRFADVKKVEALSLDDKQAWFTDLLSACTRCYACRNACPLCYCPTCFVDESQPQWVGKTINPTDVATYHLVRAFHNAGRCTDCGACEAACPMDIPVRAFTRKTIKDTGEAFGWETGMDMDLRPPLDRFDIKDPGDFIR